MFVNFATTLARSASYTTAAEAPFSLEEVWDEVEVLVVEASAEVALEVAPRVVAVLPFASEKNRDFGGSSFLIIVSVRIYAYFCNRIYNNV